MGTGSFHQVLSYKDAEAVLRDPETFSSSINAEHIGQFMGDLILGMNGEEHRKYRNLVAKAFRASQLEKWDDTLVRPDDQPPARRDRAARARRPRRVRHVAVPDASDLRDRRCAARGRRRSSRSGPRRSTPARMAPERGHAASRGDGRLPAAARRSAPRQRRPATSSPISCTPRSTASSSPTARSTASCGCCLPAGGETTFRVMGNALFALLTHPDDARAGAYADRDADPRGHRGDAAVGDVGDDGEPRRGARHRGRGLPDRDGLAGRRDHRLRRTATRRAGRTPTSGSSAGRCSTTSRSAPVRTSASGCTSRGSSCGSASTRSSTACRTCGSTRPARDAVIEGYAFRGPRALPVLFDPS